jgi:hypothetical protein
MEICEWHAHEDLLLATIHRMLESLNDKSIMGTMAALAISDIIEARGQKSTKFFVTRSKQSCAPAGQRPATNLSSRFSSSERCCWRLASHNFQILVTPHIRNVGAAVPFGHDDLPLCTKCTTITKTPTTRVLDLCPMYNNDNDTDTDNDNDTDTDNDDDDDDNDNDDDDDDDNDNDNDNDDNDNDNDDDDDNDYDYDYDYDYGS